jgi:transposase
MPATLTNSQDTKSDSQARRGRSFAQISKASRTRCASLGIDVSKAKLNAVVSRLDTAFVERREGDKEVSNTAEGVQQLCTWACRIARCKPGDLRVVLEASSHHWLAARTAHSFGCQVVVMNPRRIRAYASTIGRLTKSDPIDAHTIASFGLHVPAHIWSPPPPQIDELTALLRRRTAIEDFMRRDERRGRPDDVVPRPASVVRSVSETVTFLAQASERIHDEIETLFKRHPDLDRERKLLMSIPGIGDVMSSYLLSVLRLRSFSSAREAAAFCGVVPLHNQSGERTHTKGKISRECDGTIRAALYLPTLAAIRSHVPFRQRYEALIERGKHHNQAVFAMMNKIVRTAFGVLRNGKPYRIDWTLLSEEERAKTSPVPEAKRTWRRNEGRLSRLGEASRSASRSPRTEATDGRTPEDARSKNVPRHREMRGTSPVSSPAAGTTKKSKRVKRTRRRWTEADTELLRKSAGEVSIEALARTLGRSERSIQVKGSSLGLSMRYYSPGPSPLR